MYRIVELSDSEPGADTEIGAYDSAYAALEVMRRAVLRGARNVARWRLVDPGGTVLAEPVDALEAA